SSARPIGNRPPELRFFAYQDGQRDLVLDLAWVVVDAEFQAVERELAFQLQTRIFDIDGRGEADLARHAVQGELARDLAGAAGSGHDLGRFEMGGGIAADLEEVDTLEVIRQHVANLGKE